MRRLPSTFGRVQPFLHLKTEEREDEQVKELKELNEVMTSLWWQYEISDEAKLWWNDLVSKLMKEEESNV